MRSKLKRPWMIVTLMVACGIAISGCAVSQPVNSACGVIHDGLKDVHATTKDGDRRISDHYERGKAVGCWS